MTGRRGLEAVAATGPAAARPPGRRPCSTAAWTCPAACRWTGPAWAGRHQPGGLHQPACGLASRDAGGRAGTGNRAAVRPPSGTLRMGRDSGHHGGDGRLRLGLPSLAGSGDPALASPLRRLPGGTSDHHRQCPRRGSAPVPARDPAARGHRRRVVQGLPGEERQRAVLLLRRLAPLPAAGEETVTDASRFWYASAYVQDDGERGDLIAAAGSRAGMPGQPRNPDRRAPAVRRPGGPGRRRRRGIPGGQDGGLGLAAAPRRPARPAVLPRHPLRRRARAGLPLPPPGRRLHRPAPGAECLQGDGPQARVDSSSPSMITVIRRRQAVRPRSLRPWWWRTAGK